MSLEPIARVSYGVIIIEDGKKRVGCGFAIKLCHIILLIGIDEDGSIESPELVFAELGAELMDIFVGESLEVVDGFSDTPA